MLQPNEIPGQSHGRDRSVLTKSAQIRCFRPMISEFVLETDALQTAHTTKYPSSALREVVRRE